MALGARVVKQMRMFEAKVGVEVAFGASGIRTRLARKGLELEVNSINVPLEGKRTSKDTCALKTSDRSRIVVVFDNLLWMN